MELTPALQRQLPDVFPPQGVPRTSTGPADSQTSLPAQSSPFTALPLCPVQLKCANGQHDEDNNNNELGPGLVDCDKKCQTCSASTGKCVNKTNGTSCNAGTGTGSGECTGGKCVVRRCRDATASAHVLALCTLLCMHCPYSWKEDGRMDTPFSSLQPYCAPIAGQKSFTGCVAGTCLCRDVESCTGDECLVSVSELAALQAQVAGSAFHRLTHALAFAILSIHMCIRIRFPCPPCP